MFRDDISGIMHPANTLKLLLTEHDFNPLPDKPIKALPIQQQIKIWCQNYGQMGIQLFDSVENIVGKGEIARYEQFLLFPQCSQKLFVVDASK